MNNTYVFKIMNNILYIDKYSNKTNKKDLVFSSSYINNNYDLVTAILELNLNSNNVNTCIINVKNDLLQLIKLISNFSCIKKITFTKNVTIDGILFSILNNNDNVENVECYNLDKNALKVLNRHSKYYLRHKYIKFKKISAIVSMLIIVSTAIFIHFMYYELKEYNSVNDSTNKVIDIRDNYGIKITNLENKENSIGMVNTKNNTDYSKVLEKVAKLNSDTVGWITINDTKIDYPVVKTSNNDYYLNHDFNKKENSKGWIFMDARNNPSNLDNNTIIYGHNIVSSGIMYADLVKLFSKSYYDNNDNNYIFFNTKKTNMTWKIISVYKTSDNTNYIRNKFKTSQEFYDFITEIQNKSEIDFGNIINPNVNTKILTLSTCRSDTTRYVVHAILQQ